jgi:recombinational DNA repair protein RecT
MTFRKTAQGGWCDKWVKMAEKTRQGRCCRIPEEIQISRKLIDQDNKSRECVRRKCVLTG